MPWTTNLQTPLLSAARGLFQRAERMRTKGCMDDKTTLDLDHPEATPMRLESYRQLRSQIFQAAEPLGVHITRAMFIKALLAADHHRFVFIVKLFVERKVQRPDSISFFLQSKARNMKLDDNFNFALSVKDHSRIDPCAGTGALKGAGRPPHTILMQTQLQKRVRGSAGEACNALPMVVVR